MGSAYGRIIRSILAGAAAGTCVWAAPLPAAVQNSSPRLIVMIVADQMSDGLLDRYGPYMQGGFRRLLDQGRRFENAVVDHAPTNSLPGHLTVATGAFPRRHGIVDNSWIEIQSGEPVRVLGFSDPDCPANPVRGTPQARAASDAGMGPGRFESPTIVEWVLAADPRARFASVGTGGGVSVLHAGKAKGPVLWYDADAGGYVTSSCYAPVVPEWASALNSRLDHDFASSDWNLVAPSAMRPIASRDDAPHENGGSGYVFPHKRPEDPEQRRRWLLATPFADSATLALARAAVIGERLGEDDVTDILTIGLSTLDHVGHAFGPTSLEQADTLFRIDRELGTFLEFLDGQVGEGNWSLALSADHGAPPAPEEAKRLGIAGARRISEAEASAALQAIVTAADRQGDPKDTVAAASEAARGSDFVAHVLTPAMLETGGAGTDPLLDLYAKSYRQGRVSLHPLYQSESGRSAAEFGLILVPHPYLVIDWAASIHGSPYDYDREVEMLFYGPGVSPGRSEQLARTVDVAPTLAKLANVKPTSPVDGRPLDLTGATRPPSSQ